MAKLSAYRQREVLRGVRARRLARGVGGGMSAGVALLQAVEEVTHVTLRDAKPVRPMFRGVCAQHVDGGPAHAAGRGEPVPQGCAGRDPRGGSAAARAAQARPLRVGAVRREGRRAMTAWTRERRAIVATSPGARFAPTCWPTADAAAADSYSPPPTSSPGSTQKTIPSTRRLRAGPLRRRARIGRREPFTGSRRDGRTEPRRAHVSVDVLDAVALRGQGRRRALATRVSEGMKCGWGMTLA